MWPSIKYETLPWKVDIDDLLLATKTQRRKMASEYKSSIPASIANEAVNLDTDLLSKIYEVQMSLSRFDQMQYQSDIQLPALLLRSESSSSSQIENLTSSVRDVALAELSDKAPSNALLIAHNVKAMREALELTGDLTINKLVSIQETLMKDSGELTGIRDQAVWIGGNSLSPANARFVPPSANRVPAALDDLITFSKRLDMPAIAKAAIFHAQFETIHPFCDGNGRTGRALIHQLLKEDQLLKFSMLPISAGLLHDVDRYMDALDSYHDGNIYDIIDCLTDAIELALVIGAKSSNKVKAIVERWEESNIDRADAVSHSLPSLLIEQPVINTKYLEQKLEISDRSTRHELEKAQERGIVQKFGNAKRGTFYQAGELIELLEQISSISGIRRITIGSN